MKFWPFWLQTQIEKRDIMININVRGTAIRFGFPLKKAKKTDAPVSDPYESTKKMREVVQCREMMKSRYCW